MKSDIEGLFESGGTPGPWRERERERHLMMRTKLTLLTHIPNPIQPLVHLNSLDADPFGSSLSHFLLIYSNTDRRSFSLPSSVYLPHWLVRFLRFQLSTCRPGRKLKNIYWQFDFSSRDEFITICFQWNHTLTWTPTRDKPTYLLSSATLSACIHCLFGIWLNRQRFWIVF